MQTTTTNNKQRAINGLIEKYKETLIRTSPRFVNGYVLSDYNEEETIESFFNRASKGLKQLLEIEMQDIEDTEDESKIYEQGKATTNYYLSWYTKERI